jgi:streptomycin 6-kinase
VGSHSRNRYPDPVIAVRDVVRNKALAAGAGQWLRDLPGLVASLERDWSISVGRAYDDPTEAFVAEAMLADGTPTVLKLHIPRPGRHMENELTVLSLTGMSDVAADGGCVRLLNADRERRALLLERLGRPMSELDLPLPERLEILCATAARVWRPAPGCGLPTGADKGRRMAAEIPKAWEELGHPCSERAVAHAVACARTRAAAHADERAVLLHGDVHQWNALESASGFKLVDPDGLLAEPEYDLGVLMREDPVELIADGPHERARWLAARTGLDATAIWEWGVAERVFTGLIATRIGLQPVGAEMLAAADHIAALP